MVVANYNLSKDYLYPPFIYSVVWFCVILFYMIILQFHIIEINTVSALSLLIFIGGVFSFSLGGFTIFAIKNKLSINRTLPDQKIIVNKLLDNIFFILPIIFLPLYILEAIKISHYTGIDNFFIGLRWGLNYDNQSYGYLQYFVTFSIFNCIYRILIISKFKEFHATYKYKAYISLCIALIYIIFSTGRTGILFVLISLIGVAAVNRSLSIKKIIFSVAMFLIAFFLYAVILKKGGSEAQSFYINLVSVNNIILEYIFGSLPAFDSFIHTSYDLLYGENTFRILYLVLSKLSFFDGSATQLVQPFVEVPFSTNVYTIYKHYILDFDILGSFIVIYIIGSFHTYLYSNIYKDLRSKMLFILFLYPLIFSFFQDQFFSLSSTWIQYYILTIFTFKYIIKYK